VSNRLLNRRDLLKQAALSTLAFRTGHSIAQLAGSSAKRTINALQLEPFVDPLPLPQLLPNTGHRGVADVPFFSITMREIRVKMHRDLAPTRLWSYGPEAIGPLIEARKDEELP
jgi:spore coat protein A